MPRIIRGDTAQRIFHALNRGVERRDIFLKAEDYAFFLSQAREVLSSFGISLLSYCLMPNHFHFRRFKAFEVADEEYLSWLPVYIHRNPVKAQLTQAMAVVGAWRTHGRPTTLSRSARIEPLRL